MYTIPASLIGLTVSGDLGGTTIYTDRYGQKTVYPFSPPKDPPSLAQIRLRARFKAAQAAWRALSADEKRNLELAVNAAALCMTGQNVYVSACLTNRAGSLATLAHQTGFPLPAVTPIFPA